MALLVETDTTRHERPILEEVKQRPFSSRQFRQDNPIPRDAWVMVAEAFVDADAALPLVRLRVLSFKSTVLVLRHWPVYRLEISPSQQYPATIPASDTSLLLVLILLLIPGHLD
jgi:hypothetical protein